MKKIIIYLTQILCCIATCLLTQGCNDKNDLDLTSGKYLWQEHIKMAQESKDNLFEENNMAIVGYNYIQAINSQSDINQVKSTILSDDSYAIFYAGSLDEFRPMKIASLKNEAQFSYTSMKEQLDTLITTGLHVVCIDWTYDNNSFKTLCIVSNEVGIIYDNILSNLIYHKSHVFTDNHQSILKFYLPDLSCSASNHLLESISTGGWLGRPYTAVAELYHVVTGVAIDTIQNINSIERLAACVATQRTDVVV